MVGVRQSLHQSLSRRSFGIGGVRPSTHAAWRRVRADRTRQITPSTQPSIQPVAAPQNPFATQKHALSTPWATPRRAAGSGREGSWCRPSATRAWGASRRVRRRTVWLLCGCVVGWVDDGGGWVWGARAGGRWRGRREEGLVVTDSMVGSIRIKSHPPCNRMPVFSYLHGCLLLLLLLLLLLPPGWLASLLAGCLAVC